MNRLRLGLLVMGVAAAFVGCGGRVIDDSGSDGFSPSDFLPAGHKAGNNSGSGGKPGTSSPGKSLPTTKLGECVPGFLRAESPGLPCRWLTESGQCFDDSDAACACICPTNRESVCAHGFDGGPNGAKLIVCD